MTPENRLSIYKAAYKQAGEFLQEYAKHPMKPFVGPKEMWDFWKARFGPGPKPAPLPKAPAPVYPKTNRVVENGTSQAQNFRSWNESLQGSVRPIPTWTSPSANNLELAAENGFGYDARRQAQEDAMTSLNNAIRSGVSPRVRDSYNPNSHVNMSREAMIRRINAIRMQQERDKALLGERPSQVVAR